MTRLSLALLSVLVLATVSIAQEQAQDPIDKALEACIEKNASTAGMVACTDKGCAAWDKELNKNYVELMRTLKPGQKDALRLAQLEWIKYQDLDFKLIDSIYDTMQGTMRVDARLEVIKKRALQLKGYLDLITEGEQVNAWPLCKRLSRVKQELATKRPERHEIEVTGSCLAPT